MSRAERRFLQIGCGKMGGVILNSWLSNNVFGSAQFPTPCKIIAVDPAANPFQGRVAPKGVTFCYAQDVDALSWEGVASVVDVLVVAIKPQLFEKIVPAYQKWITPDTLVLSIAAGKTLASLQQLLGPACHVRIMPNLPASVGEGVMAYITQKPLNEKHKAQAELLMRSVGQMVALESEAQMDAVTAVSGSGPAYLFHLAEALEAAAISVGLGPENARALAYQTIIGSAELLKQSLLLGHNATQLREQVTSPQGTTAAALDVLMKDNALMELITRAVVAATERSKKLSS